MSVDVGPLREGLDRWGYMVLDAAVNAMPDLIRPAAPLGVAQPESTRVPGQLRESITVGSSVSPGGPMFNGRVSAPVIQARTTDQGSPPHRIEGNPLLRFFWPNGPTGAHVYVFRSVNHPGNAAQNWWAPAVRMAFTEALLAQAVAVPFTG